MSAISLTDAFLAMLPSYPLLLSEALAAVGILFLLIETPQYPSQPGRLQRVRIGLAFGLAVFIITMITSLYATGPVKPQLRSDLLFLAGAFGGVIGVSFCAVLTLIARYWFGGGPSSMGVAMLDIAFLSLFGLIGGFVIRRRGLSRVTLLDCLMLVGLSRIGAITSYGSMGLTGLISTEVAHRLVTLRVALSIVSCVLICGIVIMLRSKQRQHEQREARRQQERTDYYTGLPNRLALIEHVTGPNAPERCVTILVETSNQSEMLVFYGPGWAVAVRSGVVPAFEKAIGRHSGDPLEIACFGYSEAAIAVVIRGAALDTLTVADLIEEVRNEVQWHSAEAGTPAPRLRFAIGDCRCSGIAAFQETLQNLVLTLRETDDDVCVVNGLLLAQIRRDEHIRRSVLQWCAGQCPPLLYQPIVDMQTGSIVGAEALLRAHDEDGQPLPPPVVLAVCERNGLSWSFEWSCIVSVIRNLKWMISLGHPIQLCVNISNGSLNDAQFHGRVAAALDDAGVPPGLLCLEVTETTRLLDSEIVWRNVARLHDSGIGLALDDFGNGYSALKLLAQHEFTRLKTDWWMVAHIDRARTRNAMSLAVEAAHKYQIDLVVEGIETREQIDTLRAMGARYGQGFHFARAVQLDHIIDRIERGGYVLQPAEVS